VKVLKTQKIFFAHKSVGGNLMDGIQNVALAHGGIVMHDVHSYHTNLASILGGLNDNPAFVGYEMGNVTPRAGKITAFENIMNSTVHDKVDIAFMKFCYVDFEANTDVESLFAAYKNALTQLQAQFPKVLFVHITVPLNARRLSWQNKVREQFNALLRSTYGALVFDLATLASVDANGTTAWSDAPSAGTIALADDWTNDGGHLNDAGQKRFGGALIAFLAQVAADKKACVCTPQD